MTNPVHGVPSGEEQQRMQKAFAESRAKRAARKDELKWLLMTRVLTEDEMLEVKYMGSDLLRREYGYGGGQESEIELFLAFARLMETQTRIRIFTELHGRVPGGMA